MKKNFKLEQMLNSELEEVKGGQSEEAVCICENGGAGATVIVVEEPEQPAEPEGPVLV